MDQDEDQYLDEDEDEDHEDEDEDEDEYLDEDEDEDEDEYLDEDEDEDEDHEDEDEDEDEKQKYIMGAAFPSAILDSVLKQLESPIFQRYSKLNYGLGIQLRDLRSKLDLIKDVIYEAELMGILFPKLVRVWMCELERILYEVDDLLDEVVIRTESGVLKTVRLRIYSLPFQHWKFSHRMKNYNERLEGIVKECCNCNLLVGGRGDGNEKPVARKGILRYNPDYMKDDEFQMIGRDKDKKKVIEILLDENPASSLLWITGPAGVGKTTLCRAVYNDEEVSNHFDIRLWVDLRCIEGFSFENLLKKILREFNGGNDARLNPETDEASQLRDNLASYLGCSKTFLVLEGCPPYNARMKVESKFEHTVENLSNAMPAGSRILVPKIDSRSGCIFMYKLENNLSEGHSWLIFENTARVARHVTEVEWVEDLGRQIVRRCEGNPALLKGVGTLLCGHVSEDSKPTWKYFASEFDFRGQYGHYSKMMLPHYVFQKFHLSVGYLSLFFYRCFKFEALITQLAANGFTNMSDELQQDFKDTFLGEHKKHVGKYVEDEDWEVEIYAKEYLINFNVFETIRQLSLVEGNFIRWDDDDGKSIGWEDEYGDEICERRLPELPQAARQHVSILRPPSDMKPEKQGIIRLPHRLIEDVIHKRSLHFQGTGFPVRMSVQTLDTLASNFRYLRVLDLQDLALKDLPSSISKLIHLRYLDVSRSDFKELPGPICRLKNLQTLRLVYCDKLIRLPDRVKNIHNLKHLEINMCLDLTHMPPRIAELTCLQRLDRFVVCPRKGGLRYLESLDKLEGHLAIEFPLHWENSEEDAEKANLERKKGLTFLEFKCRCTKTGDEDNGIANVLEKLKPSTNIENLSIVNFAGATFPSWITPRGMGTCLTRINISRCRRCTQLPQFDVFPKLKYLTLASMMKIEYLQDSNRDGDASSTATDFLPCLSELIIGNMPLLKGWSSNLHRSATFSSLEKVEIWKCPHLKDMPYFRMIEKTPAPNYKFHRVIFQEVSEEMLPLIVLENSLTWLVDSLCGDVKIVSIQDMVSLPITMVANLPQFLEVEDCKGWQSFWTEQIGMPHSESFQRLEKLSIANCRAMKHLSSALRRLINLVQLEIYSCSEELDCLYDEDPDGMPWKALKSLIILKIGCFEKLQAIPQSFTHLSQRPLSLSFTDCRSLKWGVDSLPRLGELRIKSCPLFSEELKRQGHHVCWTDYEGFEHFVLRRPRY